jgi:tetratricopeptide (TPR) repeat protein
MEEKLDFSLPGKKEKTSLVPKISIVLLLILIGLALANLLIKPSNRVPSSGNIDKTFTAEQVKELAAKLAERNLYDRAAKAWQDYLSFAKVPDTERAKTLFQIGMLLEKAGLYPEAIEYYYRSEITAKLDELEPQINTHIKDCFERLGKFSALRYELMDRTSFKKSGEAGSKVVAEIGVEKITEADLDALIERTVDNQLAPVTAFMTPDQLNEQKKKILENFKSPTTKQQFLESWLVQEILYRQALEEKLPEEPRVKSMIEDLSRSALSQQLMNKELADKINITETDLRTYYEANKDKFVEPAKKEDLNSVERQKSFDEARQDVITALLSQKRQDVQADFIKQMMDKYSVVVHTSALEGTEKSEPEK